jgi:hypothetical protein
MSFDLRIIAFAERFLSARTFELIVVPAVADLQYEQCASGLRRTANQIAVLRTVAAAFADEIARASSGLLRLTLVPACYYIFMLIICFDVSSISLSTDFLVVATLILFLSFGPVMACFWPERQRARSAD